MFLGIEIGGTKLQFGIGDGVSSQLVETLRLDINRSAGAEGIRSQIASVVPGLKSKYALEGIGVGFGGPVDMQSGITLTSHQVDGWDHFALAAWCEDELGLYARIANDCDVAALAEAKLGAGRGRRSVFYVTVGTGVGGGLVVDGKMFADHRKARAEIGHLRPGLDFTDTHDTVESIASGPGIVASMQRYGATGKTSSGASVSKRISLMTDDAVERLLLDASGADSLPDSRDELDSLLSFLSARDIANAASVGNRHALDALDCATQALGWAIAQAITLTSAEIIVIGGGVSLAGEALFFNPVRRYTRTYVFPPLRGEYEIVPAALGEEVVVHGAILLASGSPFRSGADRASSE